MEGLSLLIWSISIFFIGIVGGVMLCFYFAPYFLKKLLKEEVKQNKELQSIIEIFKKMKDNPLLKGDAFPFLTSG